MTQIQLRRDVADNWTSQNPILAQGEVGVDLTTNKFKIGNGTTAWNDLVYSNEPFVLPIASATTLGGVKAAAKTEEHTEEVVVDAAGKLYVTSSVTESEFTAGLGAKQDAFSVDTPMSLNVVTNTPTNVSAATDGNYLYLNNVAYSLTNTGYTAYFGSIGSMTFYATTGDSTTEYPTLQKDAYLMIERNFQLGDVISGIGYRAADNDALTFSPVVFGYLDEFNKFEPKVLLIYASSEYRVCILSGSPTITHPTSTRTQVGRSGTTHMGWTRDNGAGAVDMIKFIPVDQEAGTFYFGLFDKNNNSLMPEEWPSDYLNLSTLNINCMIFDIDCYNSEPPASSGQFKRFDKTYLEDAAGNKLWQMGQVTSDKHLSLKLSTEEGNILETKTDGLFASVGMTFWKGTQTAYEAIETKDPNTLYIITAE